MKRLDWRTTVARDTTTSTEVAARNEAARSADDPESQQEYWNRLAMRIRSGDPAAAADFCAAYRRGARLLFRRYLGPIGIDGLVDEALAGVIDELRRGWISQPRDMVHFLREIVARHQEVRQPGSRKLEPFAGGAQGVTERLHQRQQATLIAATLRHFSVEERTALERYYLQGEPLASVLESAALTVTDFERLKARLCRHAEEEGGSRIDLQLVKVQAAGGSS